jgi:hypothetical protein
VRIARKGISPRRQCTAVELDKPTAERGRNFQIGDGRPFIPPAFPQADQNMPRQSRKLRWRYKNEWNGGWVQDETKQKISICVQLFWTMVYQFVGRGSLGPASCEIGILSTSRPRVMHVVKGVR